MVVMTNEELLGVAWSYYIRYQKRGGYALAITSQRVVGAQKSAMGDHFEAYLGESSKATNKDRQRAAQLFAEILAEKNLEIAKESVVRISWKRAGLFHGAPFLFRTTGGDFRIVSAPMWTSLGVARVINQIVASLMMFSPDRFYNEKTGALVVQEALEWKNRHGRK